MRLLRRAATLLAITLLTLLLGSAPAWAHSRLVSSDPAQGAGLDRGPASVSLTFDEPVQAGFTTLTVIGPDGDDYHSGGISEVDDTVSVGVLPLGPAGTYQIGYRVVSADGHPVSGAVAFSLTTAGPGSDAATAVGAAPAGAASAGPAAAAGPVAADAGGAPVWPWIAGAVVLVLGGVALALRLGRPDRSRR